jgi:hypothetical protein
MVRLIQLLSIVLPLGAWASPPEFSNGAVHLGLQWGAGLWGFDRAHLAGQVGGENADVLIGDTQNNHTVSLRLGYNILGHATVEADITGTGWNLFDATRGGGGFVAGVAHWHPMELIWPKEIRPQPIDASIFFGAGYGIMGQRRGMDGTVLQTGITANYFINKAVGFGFFARGVFPQFSTFYIDYDHRDVPGASLKLTKGSGGSFWTLGLNLDFRIET